jgi:type I restriction enzyme S subunit
MNAERLLEHYEQIADAPDAIGRLRRFILDLAVRGKLVPQDANDEPASELLKRIAQEKARLFNEGTIKTRDTSLEITEAEACFEMPSGWRCITLGTLLILMKNGLNVKPDKTIGKYKVTRIETISFEKIDLGRVGFVRELSDELVKQHLIKQGDILFSHINSEPHLGKTAIATHDDSNLIHGVNLLLIRASQQTEPKFLNLVFRQLRACGYFVSIAQRAVNQSSINQKNLGKTSIPLPPLAEQHRIVAKVDELMVLCDQLEAARAERESTRDRLAAASLARLNTPDPETFQADARFALNALPALTTRPDQIKRLRQTILNLAVRGKLVSQDANDEPASELLKCISKTRKQFYAEKRVPKPKELPSIDEVDLPFPAPLGWAWSMLGDLCYQVSDGPHFSPQYVSAKEGVPFLSARNIRLGSFDLSTVKHVSHADHEDFCKRIRPEKGDIIYTKGGTTGIAKVNDLDFEFSVWVHLAVLRIEKERLYPRYIELALNSPHCYAQSQHYTQGTSNFDLGLTRMIKITIPLPPLAEQHRIVAKVDELMALCDRLEASLTASAATRRRLLDALLAQALTPESYTQENVA